MGMLHILCIGDVVGSVGCAFLRERLPGIKRLKAVDLVIANGENSADGNGITPASCRYLSPRAPRRAGACAWWIWAVSGWR